MITAANPLQRYHEAQIAHRRAVRELEDAERALRTWIAFQAAHRPRVKGRRAAAVCGTDGGYYRHVRTTRTAPCDACLFAHREAERYRRVAREAKAQNPTVAA
jgi:hypothetical protein